jgi:hypothetical protein
MSTNNNASMGIANLRDPCRQSIHTSSTQATSGQSVMGIVWAIPVRPDRLGYELSIFAGKMEQIYLPLTRFRGYAGKPGNACARLPPELLRMITCLVLDLEVDGIKDSEDMWLRGYVCSQDTCNDEHHVTKDIIERYAGEFDKEFGMDNFDYGDRFPWEEDSDWDAQNENGSREDDDDSAADKSDDSEAKLTPAQRRFLDERANSIHLNERGGGTRVNDDDYEEQITEWILEHDDFSVIKEQRGIIQDWLKLFRQYPGGHFARLDEAGTPFLQCFVSFD